MDWDSLAQHLEKIRYIHLVGIGGSGMSGAAQILRSRGYQVSGSDSRPFPAMEGLSKQGVQVFIGQCAENVPAPVELLVISAAIPDENPEVIIARSRSCPIVKYATLLGALMKTRRGVAVAGTHGKTTTTSMIAWALRSAGLGPGYLIGGSVPQLGGNAEEGDSRIFVAEACEFDRSFLNLHPEVAAITNIDKDHLDYYRDIDEIRSAFSQFAAGVRKGGCLILGRGVASQIDWPSHVKLLRVGKEIQPHIVSEKNGRYSFKLEGEGLEPVGTIQLRVPGQFNVENAAIAAAVLKQFFVPPKTIRDTLSRYAGALRRFTLHGERDGVTVVDDYGHHPTEIRVVLQAALQVFPGRRILLAFQPHQASRTRILFDEFVDVLVRAHHVFLPEIYRARDSEEDWQAVSSQKLAERIRQQGGNATFMPDFDSLLEEIQKFARPSDVLLTMGAGNIYEIAERFVRAVPVQRQPADKPKTIHYA